MLPGNGNENGIGNVLKKRQLSKSLKSDWFFALITINIYIYIYIYIYIIYIYIYIYTVASKISLLDACQYFQMG